ncbi:MAG: ATP-binding cassette domain-containing protein [Bacteroidia bacterium]|nr:ATP-binding cassette domain-containing protein [Bacteroidia bacterium]
MAIVESSLSPIKRFFGLLKPDRQEIISIYIYTIFNGLVNLSLPLGIQAIINFVSSGQASTSWILLTALVIAGIGVSGIMQLIQLSIVENLQRKIFTRSSFEFAYRIPRMKWETLSQHYPPELVNRFFDTMSVQKGLAKLLIDLPTATLQIVFGFILLSFYHPFFIVFSLILIGLLILIFALSAPGALKTSLKESKYKYEVAHWLEEVARTMEIFKLAGKTDLYLKKTDKAVGNYLNARKSHFRILVFQYINMVGFKMIVSGTLLILGGILVMDQRLNVGQFVAAEILIVLMINSVEKIILSMENVYDVLTSVEKLGNVMDLPLESDKGIEMHPDSTVNGINLSIKNLSFRFFSSGEYHLKNIHMDIHAGEKVCIIGEEGSGKSLLLKVISGLYSDFSGSIAYNKIPLGNLNLDFIRDIIGDSTSNASVFKGSILDNITIGKENLTFEDAQLAAKITGLEEYIMSAEEGYNTQLLPEGRTLSDTIIHQIILSRCIVGTPPIMLFENHFFHLPQKIRTHFLTYILGQSNPSTVIVTSNTIPPDECRFDRYYVLKNGELVFAGNKQDATIAFLN